MELNDEKKTSIQNQHWFFFFVYHVCLPSVSSSLFWLYVCWLSQPAAGCHFNADSSSRQVTSVKVWVWPAEGRGRKELKICSSIGVWSLRCCFQEQTRTLMVFVALKQHCDFYYPLWAEFTTCAATSICDVKTQVVRIWLLEKLSHCWTVYRAETDWKTIVHALYETWVCLI